MKVWMLSPEMAPFSKVGGLGDVVGALPGALAPNGVETTVIIPHLKEMESGPWDIVNTGLRLEVESGGSVVPASVLETKLEPGGVRVLFIHCPSFFHRNGLYGTGDGEFWDNAQRFAFFSRAALEAGKIAAPGPDVIHAHDWPAALALFLARAKEHLGDDPELSGVATVQSVHNLSHQGLFEKELVPELGISWKRFNHNELEFYDTINFLKGGLVNADAIVAVSPTYAREIQHPENGWGLDGVLRERADILHGILNGIDTVSYDPAADKALFMNYSAADLAGKALNRAKLKELMGLLPDDSPVVGLVTRFVHQKGLDIFLELGPRIQYLGMQWALLGTGDRSYEEALTALAASMPGAMGLKIGFSEELARRIYAGSDFFFMPSLFEPCGLSQMIALRYGSVPVVRRTGGLNDTVTDYGDVDGVGVVFDHPTADDANHALWRAGELWKKSDVYALTRLKGMEADFSWAASAKKYADLYRSLRKR